MSDGKKEQTLNPAIERLLGVLRRNVFVSIIIVLGTILLAGTEVVHKTLDVWKDLKPTPDPELSIALLDQHRPQSSLTVKPNWKNRLGSGFSDSLTIPIAVKNSGSADATHVAVYLVYPPGVFKVEQSTGTSTAPAVLGDVMPMTGYENVEAFNIDRVDRSHIATVFEKDLMLQFRFRQSFGVPMIISNVPTIVPISIDFRSSYSKSVDEFPILYTINYSEAQRPVVGSLLMRLDQSKRDLLQKPNYQATINVIKKNSPPAMPPGKRTDTVDVQFFADGFEGLDAACHNATPRMATFKVFEERNDNDVWTDIAEQDGEEVILLDRGNDGTLDRVFYRFLSGEWWELGPTSTAPYVPLSDVFKVSTSTCLGSEIVSGLGIKR
jgi:hypothetical protein